MNANKDRIWNLVARKLANEASLSELDELDRLLKLDPEIANAVYFVLEYWDLPIHDFNEDFESSYQVLTEKLNQQGFSLQTTNNEEVDFRFVPVQKTKLKLKTIFLFSILFFTILGATYYFYKLETSKAKTMESVIVTKNGSRSKIQLADGSIVTLNSNSKLTYDNSKFGTKVREVFLTGEAYFDVTKNPNLPFIVHTDNMDVKVLGTEFNVKCYPGERTTETSLIHGSVEVMIKDRQEKLKLAPNEKLVINNNGSEESINSTGIDELSNIQSNPVPIIEITKLTLYPNTNDIVETSWLDNKLTFKNEKFETIVTKMHRWYNVNIVIKDRKLKNELLTGTFEKETVFQAIKALQFTAAFNYKVINDTIVISK